jgi:hypothetical protein
VVVKQSLVDSFAPASVVTVEIADDKAGPLRVIATLRTSATITEAEVNQAEQALAQRLEAAVDLSVVVLQVVRPLQVTPGIPSAAKVVTPTPIVE